MPHAHTHRPAPVDVSFYCNNMFFSSQQRQLFSSASFLKSQSRFFISSSLGEPKGWRRKQRTTQRLSLLSRQLSIIRGCEPFPTNLAVLYIAVLNARRDPEHLQHVSQSLEEIDQEADVERPLMPWEQRKLESRPSGSNKGFKAWTLDRCGEAMPCQSELFTWRGSWIWTMLSLVRSDFLFCEFLLHTIEQVCDQHKNPSMMA